MSTAPIPNSSLPTKKLRSRAPRLRVEKLTYVDLGQGNGGFAINLSEAGMAFHGVQALQKDKPFQIKFTLPGLRSTVESAAQIVWLNEAGKGGGLQFIEMPELSARLIREWIALQVSAHHLADTNPLAQKRPEMRPLNPSPAVRPANGGDRSSRNIYSRALAASANSPSTAPESAKIIVPVKVVATPSHPIEMPVTAAFRNPLLKTGAKNHWRVTFPFVLATGLGVATFLGVASYQLHWTFDVPRAIPNPTPLFDNLAAKPSPRTFTEKHRVEDQPNVPFNFTPTDSLTATPPNKSPGAETAMEMSDVTEAPVQEAQPAKKSVPLKMKPPQSVPHHSTTNAERVSASQIPKAATPEIAAPVAAAPVKSELAASLPAVPPAPTVPVQVPTPAPVAHEPAAATGVVEPAQLISRKSPVYPPAVRGAGFFGSVEMHFVIGADGAVHDVNMVKGNPLLGRAATEALQAWRYKPARRDGVPVESESSMTFVFDSN